MSLHLPRPITAEWSIEATGPHLQWRNRAGLAPDFPVMPDMGTKGDKTLARNEMVEDDDQAPNYTRQKAGHYRPLPSGSARTPDGS
jgi:hypothetical protein